MSIIAEFYRVASRLRGGDFVYNNDNNLFLIRRKLTSEYDQMRLTTITACNNYNKVNLRIPKTL